MTLEDFVGESIDRSVKRGFHPIAFMRLRAERGTVSAIKRVVESGAAASGFQTLLDLGMTEWSLEAAVVGFPDRFGARTIAHAQARMDGVPVPDGDR